jgi:hypothetical protein
MNRKNAKRLAVLLLKCVDIAEQKDWQNISLRVDLNQQVRTKEFPVDVVVTEIDQREPAQTD